MLQVWRPDRIKYGAKQLMAVIADHLNRTSPS